MAVALQDQDPAQDTHMLLLLQCMLYSFREQAALPGSSPVSSAYRTLRLCPANSQHCEGNIMQAFKILGGLNLGSAALHCGLWDSTSYLPRAGTQNFNMS